MYRITPLLILLLSVALIACDATQETHNRPPTTEGQPATIAYGEETCTHTGEIIDDRRYGAIITTTDGERLPFASVEDMVQYELKGEIAESAIEERWVLDVVRTSRLLKAADARYLRTKNQPSPGGLNLSPFEGGEDLSYNMRFLLDGDDLSWEEVVSYVCDETSPDEIEVTDRMCDLNSADELSALSRD